MKTRCEIRFGIEDVSAKEDATLSSSPMQSFSNIQQLHDTGQEIKPWGTLEGGGILLDGSYLPFPDCPEEEFMGLWSVDQTDENRTFAVPPSVTAQFTQPHSSLGITLTFSPATGERARSVIIRWFDQAGDLMASETFTPDAAVYFCSKTVENYYKITMSFEGTNKPHHWLKLTGIRYGVLKVLGEGDLTSASVLEETDPISNEVRISTLGFSFYYPEGEFDLLDLSGAFSLFQQRQRADVTGYIDGQAQFVGSYYLSKVKTGDNEAQVTSTDLIGVIDGAEYMGGFWPSGITAGALVAQIMAAADASDLYELDQSYQNVSITGYLPICSPREALQQVAFVLGAMVTCARSEKIRIVPPPNTVMHTVTPNDKVAGHTLEQGDLVTGVEVYVHEYSRRAQVSEISKETRTAGEHLVRFPGPFDGLSCSGATIIDSGINYAKLSVATTREVILSGYGYDDAKSLGGSVYLDVLPANGKVNLYTADACTLTTDPQALAQRIYNYKRLRITEDGSYFPLLWAPGELSRIERETGRALVGYPVSLNIDLYGGFITKAEVVGSAAE